VKLGSGADRDSVGQTLREGDRIVWTHTACGHCFFCTVARQHRVAKRVRAGQVFVNGYGAGGGIELPFGGFKRSGHGREKGFEALYDMSATKTIVFNHG
jgi:acyl-CoA reductase-like NAD-dependent aldehyde dehydrogenase